MTNCELFRSSSSYLTNVEDLSRRIRTRKFHGEKMALRGSWPLPSFLVAIEFVSSSLFRSISLSQIHLDMVIKAVIFDM